MKEAAADAVTEPMQTSRNHRKNKKFGAVQSSSGNQHQLTQSGTRNSQRTTNAIFTQEGAVICKATLLLTPTAFSPRDRER